jgi:hypothetical protein
MNHPLVGWSSDTADRWTPRRTARGRGRLEPREPAQFWAPTRPQSFTVVCPADRRILNTTAEYSNVVTNMGGVIPGYAHYLWRGWILLLGLNFNYYRKWRSSQRINRVVEGVPRDLLYPAWSQLVLWCEVKVYRIPLSGANSRHLVARVQK